MIGNIDHGTKERIIMWSAFGLGACWFRFAALQERKRRRERIVAANKQDTREPRTNKTLGRHVSFQSEHKTYAIPKELASCRYVKELQVAIDLALVAGNNLVAYCESKGTETESHYELHLSTKGGRPEDFCTQVDVENERLIEEGILKHFPTHKVVGEEATGMDTMQQLTEDPTWIIDPIDGTTNFASGLPLSCVSIGLCDGGKPVMGVVYAPMTHELYLAVDGQGAYRNGFRIVPKKNSTTTNTTVVVPLKHAVVCAEFGYARGENEVAKMVQALQAILLHGCRSVRMLGSGVLDVCYVATGRLDLVYAGVASEGWKPWDYCAAIVVAREAGCVVEAIKQDEGADFDLHSPSIICASSKELLEEVRFVLTVVMDAPPVEDTNPTPASSTPSRRGKRDTDGEWSLPPREFHL